jgi:hypothetical protein
VLCYVQGQQVSTVISEGVLVTILGDHQPSCLDGLYRSVCIEGWPMAVGSLKFTAKPASALWHSPCVDASSPYACGHAGSVMLAWHATACISLSMAG